MTFTDCALEHVAVLHDGPAELAARLVPDVRAGIAAGDAVLVCLEHDAASAMARSLGSDAEKVTFIDAGTRYASPAHAMQSLHAFTTKALASGAGTVWSIGSIGFDGTEGDSRWIRYEAAVNDVLRHLPLKAVCSYDVSRVPSSVLEAARHTHSFVDGPEGRVESAVYGRVSYQARPANEAAAAVPPAAATVFAIDAASTARRVLSDLHRERVSPTLLSDVHLAASEMVTNGLRHGAPPVTMRSWIDGPFVRVEVTDRGPGISDPFAELRPPAGGIGGYGMWLIGQVATDVTIGRRDGTTVVAAAFLLDS